MTRSRWECEHKLKPCPYCPYYNAVLEARYQLQGASKTDPNLWVFADAMTAFIEQLEEHILIQRSGGVHGVN